MKLTVPKDAVNQSVYVFIQDSSVTTGAGKTGLVYNTSSLVCYYVRPLAAAVQLTLATQTVTGVHADGGFVEVSSTNLPGIYRLDLSDAIVATGVDSVVVMLHGAAGMASVTLELQLVGLYDVVDSILRRDWTQVATPADRSVLNALRLLRNKWDIISGILHVREEDDSTDAWTANVTATPGAVPITGSDPS